MDGQVEAAALGGEVTEEKVLEAFVLHRVWMGMVEERGVDAGGFRLRDVVEAEGTEVGDLELFGYGSVGFLLFEERRDEVLEIAVESWGQGVEVGLLEVLFSEGVFEGEELF